MAKKRSEIQAKYDSTHCKYYTFKLNLVNDADVISRLAEVDSMQGYIKQLIREDIARTHLQSAPKTEREEQKMKSISIDNGSSFVSVPEAVQKMSWDTIVSFMDDDTREAVHNEIAPCTEIEFLTRYLELAKEDLIIG